MFITVYILSWHLSREAEDLTSTHPANAVRNAKEGKRNLPWSHYLPSLQQTLCWKATINRSKGSLRRIWSMGALGEGSSWDPSVCLSPTSPQPASGNLGIWKYASLENPQDLFEDQDLHIFWSRSWTWIWNGLTWPDIGSYENRTKPNGLESFSNPSLPRHPPCDISCRAPAVHKHAAIKHTTQSERIWDSCYVFGWHKSQITPECCKKDLKTNCRPSGRQRAMQLLP